MKTSPRRLPLIGIGFLAVTFLGGCALTKDYVSLSYVPQANVAKIDGADAVTVSLDVKDVRTIQDKVSAKKNGFGMEMAAIIAKEDVARTVKSAIEAVCSFSDFRTKG